MSEPDATPAPTNDPLPPGSEDAAPSAASDDSPEPASPPVSGESSTPSTTAIEDYVNDESLDLSSSGLPAETQSEIKRLRGDAKKWRETATSWNDATAGWAPEDIAQIREALELGPQNPRAVAEWMARSAKALAPDLFDGDPAGSDDGPDVDDDGRMSADAVAKLVDEKVQAALAEVEKKQTVAQRVEAIKAETEALGFGPSHPWHEALLLTARNRFNGDLAKAAEVLRKGPDGTDTTPQQDAPAEAGHTPVPPEGATPAGTRAIVDPRKAATERVNKVLGSASGFADLQ